MWRRDSSDAGAILHEHLRVLVEEVRGAMREERVTSAADEVMRLLAVSVPDPREAEERLIAAVRRGIAAEGPDPGDCATRLLFVQSAARECLARHRMRLDAIRDGELRRSSFVAARAGARRPVEER